MGPAIKEALKWLIPMVVREFLEWRKEQEQREKKEAEEKKKQEQG